jgi:hypothetical protein
LQRAIGPQSGRPGNGGGQLFSGGGELLVTIEHPATPFHREAK